MKKYELEKLIEFMRAWPQECSPEDLKEVLDTFDIVEDERCKICGAPLQKIRLDSCP